MSSCTEEDLRRNANILFHKPHINTRAPDPGVIHFTILVEAPLLITSMHVLSKLIRREEAYVKIASVFFYNVYPKFIGKEDDHELYNLCFLLAIEATSQKNLFTKS